MKKLLVLFGLMFAIIACSNDCLNMANECFNGNSSEKNNNEPEKRLTTLQEVVDNANTGEEIDLSDYELTNYTATIDKKLTIKNGSLSNAKLQVKSEGVKLEKLTDLSVSTSSRLTITDSKLSDLLIGGNGETSRCIVVAVDMSVAMVSVTNCEIENVSLDGFNSQLNITDTTTKIDDIVISAKSKIILEAGSCEGMKDPKVIDGGEAVRVDMTKDVELSVLSIYSYPQKLEYNVREKIDLTGLVVMGTYSTTYVEVFKSDGKSEGEDTITKCEDEKDYTVECDLSKAGVSIVTITSKKNPEIKCSFPVFVKESQNADEEKTEEKIEITDVYLKIFGTAKTTYKVGERLDLSCYQVMGKYNGIKVNLPYTSEPANGAVLETAGENIEIKFHYDGGTLTQTIKVTKPWVVTFKDGNEILYTTEVADGGKLSQLPVAPSKTGYTFDGWYNGDNEFKAGDSVTSDLELKATWEKICSVILMVNGQQSIITGKYGVNVEIPDPEKREGYTFKGWEPPLPKTYSETSSTHTAILDPITYTITYENCDGVDNEECPKTYTIEEEKKLVNPTKDGYTFVGWYTNKECTEENKITQINKGTTGNITLYAVWKVQTTFYVDGTFTGETAIGTAEAPFATIQDAVNKIIEVNDEQAEFTINVQSDINPGATISYENNNSALINIVPEKKLNLKICGTYSIISASGQQQGRVMYIGGNATVTLENITLTDGVTATYDNGGGVYVAENGTLNMNSGATIQNCEASEGYGGGVYVAENGTLNMYSGAIIASCEAGLGGGVHVAMGTFEMSGSANIESCCATSGDYDTYGGGVYVGGGIFTMSDTATIQSCNVTNTNTEKKYDGGGVYVTFSGEFIMSGGEISECNAQNGGGVYLDDGTFEMSGSAVVNLGNDVYLSGNNATVTIAGELTATADKVATITPSLYEDGTQVLTVKTDSDGKPLLNLTDEIISKFSLTQPDDGRQFVITQDGKLQKQED